MQRHDVDAVGLVFGLIFLGAAVLVGIVALGAPTGTALKLAVPVVLLCAGTAGLLASTRPRR
ncbi:MAG: hypothetical protein ACT4QF_06335 [Sporichthyaceae bacterium]